MHALVHFVEILGDERTAGTFPKRARVLKQRIHERLWDSRDRFFKTNPLQSKSERVLDFSFENNDKRYSAREQIGYTPWYFHFPDAGYEDAWKQLSESDGFSAQYGITTAEQRHMGYELLTDENECERYGNYYNRSTFCDLVITGLVGLRPRSDEVLELNPLFPEKDRDYCCRDALRYHCDEMTIPYDKSGDRFGKGRDLHVIRNGIMLTEKLLIRSPPRHEGLPRLNCCAIT